jgi:hypothetical protein
MRLSHHGRLTMHGTDDRVHIEIDVCGMTAEQLSLIASKISLSPSIHRAHGHRLT